MNQSRRTYAFCAVALLAPMALVSCVQPAYDRTVVYELDVSSVPNVKSVGVRGRDKPLSWNEDRPLTQSVPGGPYTVAVTYHTGALVTEVKFTVNGEFELANKDNRTVRVLPTKTGGDTTVYRAKFDVP